MEWTPKNYEKLVHTCDIKLSILDSERRKSDNCRHKLYDKRNNGELTKEEDESIERMCKHEDAILAEENHINKLKVNVCKALDELSESLKLIK